MQRETDRRYLDAHTWLDARVLMNAPVKTDSTAAEQGYVDWAGCLNSRQKINALDEQIPFNAVTADRFVEDPMRAINDKLYSWTH